MAIRQIQSFMPGYLPRGLVTGIREDGKIDISPEGIARYLHAKSKRSGLMQWERAPEAAFYRKRDPRPIPYPIATAQQVAIGDACQLQNPGSPNATIQRASDLTYPTAIATPNAPTVAAGGAGTGVTPLTAGATHVEISYQFPWGEGPLSAAASGTPAAGGTLTVSGASMTPPSPALAVNVYVETSAGSGVYKLAAQIPAASAGYYVVTNYGNGQVPYAGNPGGTALPGTQLQVAQYNFAQVFAGISNCQKDANVSTVSGYGSSNTMTVYTEGEFQIDCDQTYTWNQSDYFAPAANAGGTALQNQFFGFVGSYAGNTPTGLEKCAVLSATNSSLTSVLGTNSILSVTGILLYTTQRPSR